MSELTPRLTLLLDALIAAAGEQQTDNTTITDLLGDLKHQLGADDDVSLTDVRNSIADMSDRMATLLEAVKVLIQNQTDFLELMNTNSAVNARSLSGLIVASACCELVLSEEPYAEPDGFACARAGWAVVTIGEIGLRILQIINHGALMTTSYVKTLFTAEVPTDAISYAMPDDLASAIAGTANGMSISELNDIVSNLAGPSLSGDIRNVIASAANSDAAVADLHTLMAGYDFTDNQNALVYALFSSTFIQDIYTSDVAVDDYDNDACGEEMEMDMDCAGGTTSIWGGAFTLADTLYPMNEFTGNKRWHWTASAPPSGQTLTVYNHDDADAIVGTAIENQVLHLLDGINYYWSASDSDALGVYTQCYKPEEE